LTVLDLFLVGMPFNPTLEPEHVFPTPGAVQFLQQEREPYRVAGTDVILAPNAGMVFEVPDVRGYDVVVPRRYTALIKRLEDYYAFHFHTLLTGVGDPLLDLLNVKYALTDQTLGGKWTLVQRGIGAVNVYQNTRALPRAFVVYDAVVVADESASLERVTDASFDYRTQVVLEERPERWEAPADPDPGPAAVRIMDYRANRVTVEVETPAPGLLVLTDNYAPGWQAAVDEERTPVYAANHAFRAVVVPAGRHRVTFTYRPLSFYVGAALSLLTLVGLSVALVVPARRRRAGL
jgi:hypothetical protein